MSDTNSLFGGSTEQELQSVIFLSNEIIKRCSTFMEW